jgi:hypothetical protein
MGELPNFVHEFIWLNKEKFRSNKPCCLGGMAKSGKTVTSNAATMDTQSFVKF